MEERKETTSLDQHSQHTVSQICSLICFPATETKRAPNSTLWVVDNDMIKETGVVISVSASCMDIVELELFLLSVNKTYECAASECVLLPDIPNGQIMSWLEALVGELQE
jgi:hypothetical protein